MNYKLFAGIDISKLKIDVTFFLSENPDGCFHEIFENTDGGCREMVAWINELTGIVLPEMLLLLRGYRSVHTSDKYLPQ